MDTRKLIPRTSSGKVAITLQGIVWRKVLDNPNMNYQDMQECEDQLEKLNVVIKRRTITRAHANLILEALEIGLTFEAVAKRYDVSVRLVIKISNNKI